MYQKERKQQILYLLQEKNEMTVAELSRLLFTSESSIRRDLQTMELSGLVKRTHGGVKLLSDNPTIVPFASRLHYKVAEKKKMAKKALSYIQDGQVIFLDQSSSALFLAHELVNRRQVTIITNNIEILATMAKSELKALCLRRLHLPNEPQLPDRRGCTRNFPKNTRGSSFFFDQGALFRRCALRRYARRNPHPQRDARKLRPEVFSVRFGEI